MSIRSLIAPRVCRGGILAAVMLLAAVVLTGCGGVAGTYEQKEALPGGESMTMTLELRKDKTASMTIGGGPEGLGGSMKMDGTYTVDGDKVNVTIAGETKVFTLKDGALTATEGGETISLTKK